MSPERGPASLQRRTTRNIVLGILFFILGVIGILVPVMPQVVFFFLSALFFSLVSPRLRRALRRFRQRHPSVDKAYAKWREKGRKRRLKHIRKRRMQDEFEVTLEGDTPDHHRRRS